MKGEEREEKERKERIGERQIERERERERERENLPNIYLMTSLESSGWLSLVLSWSRDLVKE